MGVDGVLERFEGVVAIVDAKIIYADLISGARVAGVGEEGVAARAPIGLPSMLLVGFKKSASVELWLGFAQQDQIVLDGLVVVAFLLVDETQVVGDGAGLLLHLGGALDLRERGVVLAVIVESNAQPEGDEEGKRIELQRAAHVSDGILRAPYGIEVDGILELRNRVAGIESDAAGKILFCRSPIPRVNSLDAFSLLSQNQDFMANRLSRIGMILETIRLDACQPGQQMR